MNYRLIWTVFLGVFLSGCGAHYYWIDENDMILILKKPGAKSVVLACSLDGFKPRTAKNVSGRWEVVLPADRAFKYFYRVDGEPFLPDCPMKENDDFGSETCIFDPGL
ncbi:MAG: hypothetical protein HGJ94_04745 [Desulfosarcina sp.]|nr:hypothetical protein [Desulfosarcina sp.]MBC2744728.1 hypothetical protein [Desulfosarcina sp.]MBC2767637.1 hypothetical protein [Desulfosarcina sp.]